MAEQLPILIPVALGAVAVFLLMPRARPYPRWWGAALGTIALAYAGVLLTRHGSVPLEAVLFHAFAFMAIFSAGMMITHQNPVHAALSFALVVLSTCGLFLLQQAAFLMAATIIVYAGAIIVTFLFVIMLAQQTGPSDADVRSREPLLACITGFVLLAALLHVLAHTYDRRDLDTHLARLHSASQGETAANIAGILGDREKFLEDLLKSAKELPPSLARRQFEASVIEAQEHWRSWEENVPTLTYKLGQMSELGRAMRTAGVQVAPAETPSRHLSRMSVGTGKEQVAELGRTLYTDYLLAIQLAGALLLVATVGAIAITTRRTEVAQ